MHKVFRCHKLLETAKGPPTKFFDTVRQKNPSFLCDTPSMVYQNFRTRQMNSADFELLSAC